VVLLILTVEQVLLVAEGPAEAERLLKTAVLMAAAALVDTAPIYQVLEQMAL